MISYLRICEPPWIDRADAPVVRSKLPHCWLMRYSAILNAHTRTVLSLFYCYISASYFSEYPYLCSILNSKLLYSANCDRMHLSSCSCMWTIFPMSPAINTRGSQSRNKKRRAGPNIRIEGDVWYLDHVDKESNFGIHTWLCKKNLHLEKPSNSRLASITYVQRSRHGKTSIHIITKGEAGTL
jgi:hypothetical protein